jgi:hypothetical protein
MIGEDEISWQAQLINWSAARIAARYEVPYSWLAGLAEDAHTARTKNARCKCMRTIN